MDTINSASSVEVISREQMESARLVILHFKEDVSPNRADAVREIVKKTFVDAGYDVPCLASNGLERIEIVGQLEYGVKNAGGFWMQEPSGRIFTDTKGKLAAWIENQEKQYSLRGYTICELPIVK